MVFDEHTQVVAPEQSLKKVTHCLYACGRLEVGVKEDGVLFDSLQAR